MKDKETSRYGWFLHFLLWRERHINERLFLIILSLIIGILSAFAAVLLKNTIHIIQHFAFDRIRETSYLYLIFPVVGILIRSEEHTSELQSLSDLVCRLLLEKKK